MLLKIRICALLILLSGVALTMQGCGSASGSGSASKTVAITSGSNTGPRLTSIELKSIGSANGSGFRLEGETPGDQAGLTFAKLGDFDGDGNDDFAVGAPRSSDIGTYGGKLYVVLGQTQNRLDGSLGSIGSGGFYMRAAVGDGLSTALSGAGDFNGDGKKDFLIGSPTKGLNQGEAYLLFGRNSSLNLFNAFQPVNLNPSSGALPTNGGFKLTPPTAFGLGVAKSVSGGGDFDGDGYDDIAIGGMFVGSDGAGPSGNQGQVYLSFGKPSGFANQSLTSALNPASGGINLDGSITGGNVGKSVAMLKDFNGDGLSDVVISAPGINTVYIVFGNSSKAADDNLNLDLLTGNNGGVKILGPAGIDFGDKLASLSDINGDGLTDFIINALTANPIAGTNNYQGAAYIIFGTRSPARLQNLNVMALNGINGFSVRGANLSTSQLFGFSRYGGFSDVAGVGDLNNDGFSDIALCQPATPMGAEQVGEVYILFGHSGSFAATNGLNLDTGLNGINGLKIVGDAAVDAPDRNITNVGSAGDIDSDGFDDLLLGLPNGGPINAGQVYTLYGFNFRAP